MEKLYWGPTDVAAYANISKSKAYQFIQVTGVQTCALPI